MLLGKILTSVACDCYNCKKLSQTQFDCDSSSQMSTFSWMNYCACKYVFCEKAYQSCYDNKLAFYIYIFIIWRNCWYIVNISHTIREGNIDQSESTKNLYHIRHDVIRKRTTSLLYMIINSIFSAFLPSQTQISLF